MASDGNSATEAAELQLLLDLVQDSKTSNYTFVSSLALLVFDYLLTLPAEVELVWRSRWSLGKGLFLFNRYFTIAIHSFNAYVYLNNTLSTEVRNRWYRTLVLSLPARLVVRLAALLTSNWAIYENFSCYHWIQAQPGTSAIVGWVIDLILLLRVLALWGRGRTVTIALGAFYLASSITLLVLLVLAFSSSHALPRPGPSLTGCFISSVPPWFTNIFIIPAAYTTVIFVMTVMKTFNQYRRSTTSLSTIFLRDGVMHTTVVLASIFTNLFLNKFARPTLAPAETGFYVVVPSIMGSRILLNMFEYMFRGQGFDTTRTTFNFSDLKAMQPGAGAGSSATAIDTTGAGIGDVELQDVQKPIRGRLRGQ